MESRTYKENFRNLILDMAHRELEKYAASKGAQKFFEANVDKIIAENILKIKNRKESENIYLKVLTYGSYQESVISIGKLIKKEEFFKSKKELYNFARYLNLNVNKKFSYNQILKIISKHIYNNRGIYSSKYVIYKKSGDEYIIDPRVLKGELIQRYKSKARDEMESIAKLLNIDVDEDEGAEDIRKKIINNIIKEKLRKNK